MIRPPPRSTLSSSSAASDVYKRQGILPVSAQDSLPTTNDAVPCPYIQRRRHPQHLVPVLGDQHRVEPAGQQRPGDRVAGGALGSRSGPVEGDPAQVPDPGDSCSPTSYPVDLSPPGQQARAFGPNTQPRGATPGASPVSYTHLTLPTKRIV